MKVWIVNEGNGNRLRFLIKPFDRRVNRRLSLVIDLIRYNYAAGWKRPRRINMRYVAFVSSTVYRPYTAVTRMLYGYSFENYRTGSWGFSLGRWRFCRIFDEHGALSGGLMALCLCRRKGHSHWTEWSERKRSLLATSTDTREPILE